MIVVMKRGASQEQISHVIQRVEEFGLRAHPIYGAERTVVAAIGEKRDEHRHSLEISPGVAEVVPILAPYKVASIEVKKNHLKSKNPELLLLIQKIQLKETRNLY